ncbi:hypothetical protein DAI22_07g073900 [Oryza sativa Japonica Group]|nr:hypothetical protein DAI22_07g073900 [Oryza sativa Japonica Group]
MSKDDVSPSTTHLQTIHTEAASGIQSLRVEATAYRVEDRAGIQQIQALLNSVTAIRMMETLLLPSTYLVVALYLIILSI